MSDRCSVIHSGAEDTSFEVCQCHNMDTAKFIASRLNVAQGTEAYEAVESVIPTDLDAAIELLARARPSVIQAKLMGWEDWIQEVEALLPRLKERPSDNQAQNVDKEPHIPWFGRAAIRAAEGETPSEAESSRTPDGDPHGI